MFFFAQRRLFGYLSSVDLKLFNTIEVCPKCGHKMISWDNTSSIRICVKRVMSDKLVCHRALERTVSRSFSAMRGSLGLIMKKCIIYLQETDL